MSKRMLAGAALLGFLIGRAIQLESQDADHVFASDSATGAAVAVQTNGTNALKVIGK